MRHSYRTKVLVAHRDLLWQAGAAVALGRPGDLEVLETPAQLSNWPSAAGADVIVTDFGQGLRLCGSHRNSFATGRGGRVLVVDATDRECEIRAALACGVQGYLLTGCSPDELAEAVRSVHRGERTLSLRVAHRLAENLTFEPLTSREEDVLRLLVSGLCNKSIAERLDIEVGTVKSHLRTLFGKLQVSSRTQAVLQAERRGLLKVAARAPSPRSSFTVPEAHLGLRDYIEDRA